MLIKRLPYALLAALIVLGGSYGAAKAVSILIIQQGGTGTGTFTPGLVAGNGTNPLYTTATTTASCSGNTSCSSFTVIGSSPITISSTGGSGGSGTISTSSPLVSGQPVYATGVSTVASVASSTFLTSLGGQASLTGTYGQNLIIGPAGTAIASSSIFTSPVGNIGIGSSTPQEALSVGGSNQLALFGDGGNANTYIGFAGNGIGNNNGRTYFGYDTVLGDAVVQGAAGKGIEFNVNNNTFDSGTAAVITSAGRLGIGSTSPTDTLSVVGTLAIDTNGVGTNVLKYFSSGTTGFFGMTTAASDLAILAGGSDRLHITSAGNVGIGTTTPDAGLTIGTAGAASKSAVDLTGAIYASGTGTTNLPDLFIQPTGTTVATTWSTAGTAIGVNAASGFTGNFLDFHLNGGGSLFAVSSGGNVSAQGFTTGGQVQAQRLLLTGGLSATAWGTSGRGLIQNAATWTDTSSPTGTLAAEYINAFAAPTLAFSNTGVTVTNAYNTYFSAPVAGTNATLANSWALGADNGIIGLVQFSNNNIIAPGTISAGQSGAIGFLNRGQISAPADGVFTLRNNAGTDFGRLQLGGTTSAFPAIKRNGAGIDFRLADDSGYATTTSGNIIDTGVTANSLVYSNASQMLTAATVGTGLTFTGGALTLTGTGSGAAYVQGGNAYGATGTLGLTDANQLNLITSNTPRLSITSGGNVGIGTTSPYAALSLGGGNLVIGAATTGGTPGDLFFPKLGTTAGAFLAVDGTGKVIATTSPSGGGTSYTSPPANYATTGVLAAYTYSLGVITEVANGALSVDGANPSVGQSVLVKNESGACMTGSGACNNGLYTVTAAGSGIAAFVLTRSTSYNSSSNVVPGITTYVISGTVNSDDFYAMTAVAPITIGTTGLTYAEVSGGGAAVTSVSNSDSTLTISPTNGAVVASLNLAHANTWSGLQLFSNTGTTTFAGPASTTALTVGTLSGIVRATAGYLSAGFVNLASDVTGILGISNGGTGLSSVGASSTVLTSNGSAASWQLDALTSFSTTTSVSLATTSIFSANIPNTNQLEIIIQASTTGTGQPHIYFNNDSGTNYGWFSWDDGGTGDNAHAQHASAIGQQSQTSGEIVSMDIHITNLIGGYKVGQYLVSAVSSSNGGLDWAASGSIVWDNLTSKITEIDYSVIGATSPKVGQGSVIRVVGY